MGGEGGGQLDLAAGAGAPPARAGLQRWIGVSPLLALLPSPPVSVFSSMFVGAGRWFSPPPRLPCPDRPPPPLSPAGGEGRGGRGGGAGLPLGTAVAQSISPKPRNFLLPKRKKKKKKNPSGHLSSLPHWDSRDWICGVSREGGSGLEHSQARVVEFPVRPSARPTLGFSPPSTLYPLPLLPQSWAFPSTSCCGDFCSPPQKVCAIFSHPLLGRRRG